MTRPGIEPRSPGPLANTLTAGPIDYILITSKTEVHLMQIKTRLKFRFKMTDLGKLSWFKEYNVNVKIILLKWINLDISRRYQNSRLQTTFNLCEMDIMKTSDEADLIDSKPYCEIIGSLIYIMVAARTDICYIVTRLSRDPAKPNSFI